jgi:hypothetical protein
MGFGWLSSLGENLWFWVKKKPHSLRGFFYVILNKLIKYYLTTEATVVTASTAVFTACKADCTSVGAALTVLAN